MNSLFPLRCIEPAWWLRLAAASAFGLGANAATMIEGFNYAAGTAIGGQSGGSGWSGDWLATTGNGTILAQSGSLTYPGLVSTGGKMVFTGVPATGTSTITFQTWPRHSPRGPQRTSATWPKTSTRAGASSASVCSTIRRKKCCLAREALLPTGP